MKARLDGTEAAVAYEYHYQEGGGGDDYDACLLGHCNKYFISGTLMNLVKSLCMRV